jgi:hypothetical protein
LIFRGFQAARPMATLGACEATFLQLRAGCTWHWAPDCAYRFRRRSGSSDSHGHAARRLYCTCFSPCSLCRRRNAAVPRAMDTNHGSDSCTWCRSVLLLGSGGLVAVHSLWDRRYNAGGAGTGGMVARRKTGRLETDRDSQTMTRWPSGEY